MAVKLSALSTGRPLPQEDAWYLFLLQVESNQGPFRLVGGGVHLARRPLIGLLYLPQVIMMMENFDGMKIGKENQSTQRKPAPAPLCPAQIPLDRTRATAVGSQQLTA
jgi:hypothetical protein